MRRNEHGRPSAEAVGTPVALVSGASPTPNAYLHDNMLALVREADENATDGELDEWMSYKVRWHAFLGSGDAA